MVDTEALHRSMELDGRGDFTTCIGSETNERKRCGKCKRGPDCKTLQGSHMSWLADVHRLREQI